MWGTVLVVLAIPIGALDNVLRPILIRRGVQLPMLLIIAGVIGGLLGFGVMGLFVGPVILGGQLHAGEVLGGRRRSAGRATPPTGPGPS